MIKICEYCGVEFETDRENKRFCTRKCKEKNSRKRTRKGERYDNLTYVKKCTVCGKKFITTSYDKIYCSDICKYKQKYSKNKQYMNEYSKKYYKNNKEYFKEYHKEYYKNRSKIYVCLTCGKSFESHNYQLIKPYCEECIDKKEFKHICTDCSEEFISDNIFSKKCNKCKDKKVYHIKKCIVCGKEFTANHKNTMICSDKCRKIKKNQKSKEYRKNPSTRYKYKEAQRKSKRKRLKNDLDFKLKNLIHISILNSLRRYGKHGKDLHTLEYVDYTVQELKQHLENQFKSDMNWDNHGTLWHIDHIKPKAMFRFVNNDGSENVEDIKECWKLDNLQPLYKEDNIKKSSLYEGNFYRSGEILGGKQIE